MIDDLEYEAKKRRLEDEDAKRDAERRMALYSFLAVIAYPLAIVLADLLGLTKSIEILGAIAGVFFMTTGGIVMVFLGGRAYENKNQHKE